MSVCRISDAVDAYQSLDHTCRPASTSLRFFAEPDEPFRWPTIRIEKQDQDRSRSEVEASLLSLSMSVKAKDYISRSHCLLLCLIKHQLYMTSPKRVPCRAVPGSDEAVFSPWRSSLSPKALACRYVQVPWRCQRSHRPRVGQCLQSCSAPPQNSNIIPTNMLLEEKGAR